MRLITHNMLMCNKKGVENGYPLKVVPQEIEEVHIEYNEEFIVRMLGKLNWQTFLAAVKELAPKIAALNEGKEELSDLPESLPETAAEDPALLKTIHRYLLEIHVKEGMLVCPESGREFPIVAGIPNMLLREDEV